MTTGRADYERHRKVTAQRQQLISRAGRDIGKLPKPKDPKRRKAALADLQTFCDAYFPEAFYLPWSEPHKQSIQDIQRTIMRSEMLTEAMPRGWGKSTRFERAALWGGLAGWSRFCVLVGCSEAAGIECLDSIKMELETNDHLAEDFPEVCLPIRALERITNRARGQTYMGRPTYITWQEKKIILPTIRRGAGSAFIIRVVGIDGRIRGMKETLPTGEIIRPDLSLLDDPQTDESARSPAQVAKRLKMINGAVLRLAGPKQRMAAMVSVTVIVPDDLADKLLDRKANPQWHGRRYKTVEQFPQDPKKPGEHCPKWWALMQEYDTVRRRGMAKDDDRKIERKFYLENQAALQKGVVLNWLHKIGPGDVNAYQTAFNWMLDDEDSFYAEGQNDPKPPTQRNALYTENDMLAKMLKLKRGVVPAGTSLITAMIDVQKSYLPYMVMAWREGFAGHIVDYGTFPEQVGERYFQRRTAKHTIAKAYPNRQRPQQLYSALERITTRLLGTEYTVETEREGVELVMSVDQILIDAGYETDIVNQFCRELKNPRVMPSLGDGLKPSDTPIPERTKKEGQKIGHHWYTHVPQKRSIRHLFIDTNRWKSIGADGLIAPLGATNAITLFQDTRANHRVLFDHMTAEYPDPTEARGRTLDMWYLLANRENDLFDCFVGCSVAASLRGITNVGHQASRSNTKRAAASGAWAGKGGRPGSGRGNGRRGRPNTRR